MPFEQNMNFPDISSTVFVLIDMQEKFVPSIPSMPAIIPRQKLLLNAARELGVRVLITEQYPRGLGSTIPEIKDLLAPGWPLIEKTSFSCFGSPEFRKVITQFPVKSVVLLGIEAHVCVFQTAIDALSRSCNVFVISDAIASRNDIDRDTALSLMKQNGASATTSEALLFMLLRDAAHPSFRTISKMLR